MKGWRWTVLHWPSAATAATAATLLALMSPLPSALAAEFAVSASPPRFELVLKPGERSRHVLEITNASAQATILGIKTADWTLGADNSVAFHEDLQPGSCRPWVALEKRELSVSSGRPYRFRFEINPPPDTQPGECRFAIMLEGQEQVGHAAGGLDFPFSARLGVVVYVTLGGAVPELSVVGSGVQNVNGKPTPVLQVRNSGAAHGRLAGFLSGTDAAKTELEFAPTSMPVLPGETRTIALTATRPGDPDTVVQVQFPVTISGKLEWGNGQTQNIEQRFAP